MKIYNRKLAKRIEESTIALNKLVTDRQFDPTANQRDVQEAIVMFRTRIQQDTATLAAHGYNANGDRKR